MNNNHASPSIFPLLKMICFITCGFHNKMSRNVNTLNIGADKMIY